MDGTYSVGVDTGKSTGRDELSLIRRSGNATHPKRTDERELVPTACSVFRDHVPFLNSAKRLLSDCAVWSQETLIANTGIGLAHPLLSASATFVTPPSIL